MIDWLRTNWIDIEVISLIASLVTAALAGLFAFILWLKEKKTDL